MSESQANPDLRAALVDVRKAYRLLWLYQQTLMDTYTQIVRHLDVKYYYGELEPLQRDANPAQKPPAALLPLLYIETLYLTRTGNANVQRAHDYMVDLYHIADTGYLSRTNNYPTSTCSVSQASSELWIYVFHATEAASWNWYNDIYCKTTDSDYPGHDAQHPLTAFLSIQIYGYRFDIATLTDQKAIAMQIADFKAQVRTKLGLQL